ncbi:MAG: hypothetical protein GX577_15280 [Leptolinea sp.]|nr:hypothetical protein [Leptolinea sp.]
MFKNLIRATHPVQYAIAIVAGAALALIFKEDLTPVLTGGTAFTVRSLPVQMALLILFTGFFSIISFALIRVNYLAAENRPIKPAAYLAAVGGLTGGLIFYLIYGSGTLDAGRVDWLFNLGDNAQHYLGWVFYRNDPWTWPIGFSCSLGYPIGTCMCFTDSIPLLAIPFKLISHLLPTTFQYFGLWTLLCFVLQGAFSALILYEVTGRRIPSLIAPMFFCTADVLLFRVFRYTPLTGQWIVLFALYLYFLNKRTERWNRLWPLVHVMAVLIQGYFFVMTFVVHCGTLLERYLINRKWTNAARDLVLGTVVTALVMCFVGFFTASVEMSNAGLGYFKANLNAFFNPLPGWSRFFPPLPLAEGTYAMNVNYLGVGIISLTVIGLVLVVLHNRKSLPQIYRGSWGLLLITLVLVVFALSHVVTFNEHVVFSYNLPEPFLRLWGVFRGTERMLWPVYYLVFVFAIGQTSRISSRKWVGAVLLLAAFSLQMVEVFPQLERFRTEYDDPKGKRTTLRSNFWTDAAGKFDSVVILPLSLDNWARLTEYAADNRMRINYSYYARYSPDLEPAAGKKIQELANGKTLPGEMYIIKSPELFHSVCSVFHGSEHFLGYVDGEWVLAPDYDGEMAGLVNVSITGDIANCDGLSMNEFLSVYDDKLLILAAMDNTSPMGLATDGFSFIRISTAGKEIYGHQSEKRIEFRAKKNDLFEGATLPVDLLVTSAGRLSGEEDAVIQINGRDYSYHRGGLNVVVVDPLSGEVIDTALFTRLPE